MKRLFYVIFLSVLSSQHSFAANTVATPTSKDILELKFQGKNEYGHRYWGGNGVEVEWKPSSSKFSNWWPDEPFDTYLGQIEVSIVDESNLATGPRYQELSLKEQHTLKLNQPSMRSAVGVDSGATRGVAYDAEHYLINDNPIPIYLYGAEQNSRGGFDEVLEDVIYVAVSLEGEAKESWEKEWQQKREIFDDSKVTYQEYQRERQAYQRKDQREAMLINVVVGSFLLLVPIVLWLLRFKLKSALDRILHPVRRLANRGSDALKGPSELEELKEKVRIALADEDYEEAARLSALAAQVKELKL
ncbi:hypothetical protein N9A51_01405 [Pseudomonadales bacterium]|nr:hypothetical protein [Pseudomonadales bacterium]